MTFCFLKFMFLYLGLSKCSGWIDEKTLEEYISTGQMENRCELCYFHLLDLQKSSEYQSFLDQEVNPLSLEFEDIDVESYTSTDINLPGLLKNECDKIFVQRNDLEKPIAFHSNCTLQFFREERMLSNSKLQNQKVSEKLMRSFIKNLLANRDSFISNIVNIVEFSNFNIILIDNWYTREESKFLQNAIECSSNIYKDLYIKEIKLHVDLKLTSKISDSKLVDLIMKIQIRDINFKFFISKITKDFISKLSTANFTLLVSRIFVKNEDLAKEKQLKLIMRIVKTRFSKKTKNVAIQIAKCLDYGLGVIDEEIFKIIFKSIISNFDKMKINEKIDVLDSLANYDFFNGGEYLNDLTAVLEKTELSNFTFISSLENIAIKHNERIKCFNNEAELKKYEKNVSVLFVSLIKNSAELILPMILKDVLLYFDLFVFECLLKSIVENEKIDKIEFIKEILKFYAENYNDDFIKIICNNFNILMMNTDIVSYILGLDSRNSSDNIMINLVVNKKCRENQSFEWKMKMIELMIVKKRRLLFILLTDCLKENDFNEENFAYLEKIREILVDNEYFQIYSENFIKKIEMFRNSILNKE